MSEPENKNSDLDSAEQDSNDVGLGSLHQLPATTDENEPEFDEEADPQHDLDDEYEDEPNPADGQGEAASDSAEDDKDPAGAPTATGGAVPSYLNGLIRAGAITRGELENDIDHQTSYIQLEGEGGDNDHVPLAYLQPECINQIRRRVGAGHVCGFFEPEINSKDRRYFALSIPADPNAKPEDETPETALERRLSAIEDYIGNGGGGGQQVTGPQAVQQMLTQHVQTTDLIKQLSKLQPKPITPTIREPEPEYEDEPSGIDLSGLLAPLMQQIVPTIVEAVVTKIKGGA